MDLFENDTWKLETEEWYAPVLPNDYTVLEVSEGNADRSKTPTGSLVTHTGFSSTGTAAIDAFRSRNNSNTLEDMDWQEVEAPESLSTSPTSVRTPDGDTFEQELVDYPDSMRNFYQFGDMPPRVRQDSTDLMDMSAPETGMLGYINQDPGPFITTMPQQTGAQNMRTQIPPSSITQLASRPPCNQYFAPTYTRQPPQLDPWSTEGRPRNPNVPRSDSLVFDPESDMSMGNGWLTDESNFSYMVDSNSLSPAVANQFEYGNQMNQVGMQVSISGASHDRYTFRQQHSHFSTEPYVPGPMAQQSPSTSIDAVSGLSRYQDPISPYNHVSPPGSDGVYSIQVTDPGSALEGFPELDNLHNAPSPTPTQNASNIQPPKFSDPIIYVRDRPRHRTEGPLLTRPGGRQLGSHLKPEVAKDAHDMRKVVACWHCVLQRDKCGPGDVCDRCLKRAQRPNTDCGLGCSRVRLWELACFFLPSIMTSMHEDSQLTKFVALHIHQWSNVEVSLRMTCGQGLPPLSVKVYEFIPKTAELLRQFQYITDPLTGSCVRVEKSSPPLGMIQINHKDEVKYEKYINEVVERFLTPFGRICFAEEQNEFQLKLFLMMTRLRPRADDEAKLLKDVFRLIVVTYIMGHTITIIEETKEHSLSGLRNYRPDSYVSNFCSPRMTNRQLKYFFCRLHQTIMQNVLNKLQQIFKSSKGCDKWTSAFCAILGLAMAHEDNQKTIHLVMETKAASGEISQQEGQITSDAACREIDNKFSFITAIFRWKYNRSCNPLRDSEHDWMSKLKDEHALQFVRNVSGLVKECSDYLNKRSYVSISAANQASYTSRLVGQFLLSFWLPS